MTAGEGKKRKVLIVSFFYSFWLCVLPLPAGKLQQPLLPHSPSDENHATGRGKTQLHKNRSHYHDNIIKRGKK